MIKVQTASKSDLDLNCDLGIAVWNLLGLWIL